MFLTFTSFAGRRCRTPRTHTKNGGKSFFTFFSRFASLTMMMMTTRCVSETDDGKIDGSYCTGRKSKFVALVDDDTTHNLTCRSLLLDNVL